MKLMPGQMFSLKQLTGKLCFHLIFTISPEKSSWRKVKSEIGARSASVEYIWKTYEVARFLI